MMIRVIERKLQCTMTHNRINLFYSALIFVNHFAYGVTGNMLGATLVDLRYIYDISLNVVSYLPVATGVGYLIGSLASYLYRHINRQLALIYFVLQMAVALAFVPHYGTLQIALPMLVLLGIGSGAWDSATSIWLVDMWPIGNSAILQGSQFMYGLGAIVAPILVSPFVYGDTNHTQNHNRTITIDDRIRALSWPYGVAATAQTIVPIILLVLYFVNRYEKPNQTLLINDEPHQTNVPTVVSADTDSNANESNHTLSVSSSSSPSWTRHASTNPNRGKQLLLCGLCLATYGTVELGHFSFSVALFQQLPIHLSAMKSAHVMSILSASYTLGRLTTAFISIRLQPDTVIAYHFAILFGSLTVLYIGRDDLRWITFATAGLGYGFSAMWPAIFAFTERHLRLSDRVCSLYSFLSGTVSLIIPFVLGQSFNAYPLILFYLEAAFLAVSLGLFIVVKSSLLFGETQRRRGRRRTEEIEHSHAH